MNIEQLINKDAEKNSPYVNNLVNHLPMAQFALFSITNDIKKVEHFTNNYLRRSSINKVKENYKKVNSLEECLGKRELYEACLDLIRETLKNQDIESLVSSILNKYTLGLSSGLFHTTIRLSYAMEAYELDENLKSEVERALAYYITAYREGKLLKRKISKEKAVEEMETLIEDELLKKIRKSDLSLGQKLKKLYNNEKFLKQGFTIEGNEEDKVKGLLQVLIPAFYNSNNIAVLHCITGLQAVVTLKKHFKDYKVALDIFTSTAITHLLTQADLDLRNEMIKLEMSWDEVLQEASKSSNVHTIKLAYTSKKLDDLFEEPDLKYIVNKRVNLES